MSRLLVLILWTDAEQAETCNVPCSPARFEVPERLVLLSWTFSVGENNPPPPPPPPSVSADCWFQHYKRDICTMTETSTND